MCKSHYSWIIEQNKKKQERRKKTKVNYVLFTTKCENVNNRKSITARETKMEQGKITQ